MLFLTCILHTMHILIVSSSLLSDTDLGLAASGDLAPSMVANAINDDAIKTAVLEKQAATEAIKDAARNRAMEEELASPLLKGPSHTSKSFASWLKSGKKDIMPTLLERESTKTNNPVTFNYLVKPKQMLELIQHS